MTQARQQLLAWRAWWSNPSHVGHVVIGWLIASHFVFAVGSLYRTDVAYPVLWSTWFGVACMACIVAFFAWDHTSMSVAGALTLTAYLSRMLAWPVSWVEGHPVDGWVVLMSIGGWGTMAVLAAVVFFRGLLKQTSGG